ncbi:SurA N-terminal domain-containing protein [Telmatospirillum sp.]|uniref:SurA N-terminal domain-containing protein n=1 Tax=Telmatospirillum sp. TaxID=2079197 RepID=UPI002844A0ED|nr:SurA N-terminal domain-containing protein [Telmatospirillum sp.]MDR3441003.1 SurA N-terminal domain-containing protein [Telmatospirillum sp.]
MLDSLRKSSQSWFIKILFGLLILSFGVWGIGDVVRERAETKPAITVGKQTIPAAEVAEQFRRDTERLSAMFGGKLTSDQIKQLGLMQRTVKQMVNRTLLDQAAGDLGLGADQETLRRMIANTPAFQNELKVFDKNVYERVLARAGLTERRFLAMEKSDIAREQITQMVAGGLQVPAVQAEALFRHRQETRVADAVIYRADKTPAPAKPTDAQIAQFHHDHSALFMSPEMRGFSALIVRASDVSADIKIPDSDVEKAYQVRQAEFQTPETRAIQQVLFPDADKAKAFAEAVKQGQDFAAAAKAAGSDVSDLGKVDRNGLPLPALADAAFATTAPGVVGPVESPLGWHVLRVSQIQAGKSRSLAEVKDQIVHDLAKDEATNRLYALSTKIEDSVGSGASIEEAASNLGLKPMKVAAVDERGNGPDGKPIADLASIPGFIGKTFQLGQGTTSEVTTLDDNAGYFVVRVDSVAPPALKPIEMVKDQIVTAWTQDQREQAARQQAEAAAERVRKGETLAAVAGSLKVETTPAFLRASGEKSPVPPLLAAEMFKQSKIGDVAVVAVQGGTMVARLTAIQAADPKVQSQQFDKMRDQIGETMANDLMEQYVAALIKDYGVQVNEAAIAAQFPK